MLVDSHCHLNYKGLAEQQDEVLARAGSRGHRDAQHRDARKRVG